MKRIALVIAILSSFFTTAFAETQPDNFHYEVVVTKSAEGKASVVKKYDFYATVGMESFVSNSTRVSTVTPAVVVTGFTGSIQPLSVQDGLIQTKVAFEVVDLEYPTIDKISGQSYQEPRLARQIIKNTILLRPSSAPVTVGDKAYGVEITVALKN